MDKAVQVLLLLLAIALTVYLSLRKFLEIQERSEKLISRLLNSCIEAVKELLLEARGKSLFAVTDFLFTCLFAGLTALALWLANGVQGVIFLGGMLIVAWASLTMLHEKR